jgi:hypothetical protein
MQRILDKIFLELSLRHVLAFWALFGATAGAIVLFEKAFGLEDYDSRTANPNSMYTTTVSRNWEYLHTLYPKNVERVWKDPQFDNDASYLHFLMCLKLVVDNFPQYVLLPAFVMGWGGWTLDSGYKWLRKRQAAKAPES